MSPASHPSSYPDCAGAARRGPHAAWLGVAIVLVLVALPGAAFARPSGGPAQATIDRWAKGETVAATTAGVSVVCTADGKVWGAHDADHLLYPASGTKLLTTAATLDLVPADVVWSTTVHGALGADGHVTGDLVLVGDGDPQLLPDDIDALAESLRAAGVAAVDGDLVVASGCFAGPLLPPAYDMKNADDAYRPAVSCAGSNYGAVKIAVRPGPKIGAPVIVRIEPDNDAVVVTRTAKTVAGKSDAKLTITARDREDGRTVITVGGELGLKSKGATVRKRVADPGLLTGALLARALAERKIVLSGAVRVDPRADSADTPILARVDSPSLVDAIRDMNTWSNNAMAETLFAHLGAAEDGAPATWERAQQAVAAALVARGVPAAAFVIVNGSGLYEATQITPAGMTQVLVSFAGDDPKSRAFRDSLAVAGESGTLEWRLRTKATRGLVRAKTGTLDGITSISGYVPAASGCLLAFSIIINDGGDQSIARLRRAADKLILSLARL
ncbi:MAG: D-alanyl-D-alanine carboxypeptidase/D-alanyl-D-alanine-endopeptidase [Deltaproteobacteria bacterium]|nr:MAG: D-alanyl-D-alanine carboxypeptidase/D-alanyl-D-alanine-endopeptidase [Deltaproteobacteria bacterium]